MTSSDLTRAWASRRADGPPPGGPLTFSVVVNTTDRAEPLRALLQALEHQSYSHFEVLVVVGPTKDHTLDVLSEYTGRVRVLRCPIANLSVSRNIGLNAAHSDIVAYIDDDATPCRTWLAQMAQVFADDAIDATGGTAYITNTGWPGVQHRFGMTSSWAEQVFIRESWLDKLVPEGGAPFWLTRMIGTNMAFRRSALLAVGGFDEYFEWVYDEADVTMRIAAAGGIVHPVREMVVYHNPNTSRNRQKIGGFGKWWIPVKASIYFVWKNGCATRSANKALLLRSLHLAHGHQLWLGNLRGTGRIDTPQLLQLRLRGLVGAAQGMLDGLLKSRQTQASTKTNTPESIVPFQIPSSHFSAAPRPEPRVRPITLSEPPLRICLLSSAYPPAHIDGVSRLTQLMAKGLGEIGHAVHVVAAGDHESATYADNAWVHRVPTDTSRYAQFRRMPQLFRTLNRSHTVHNKVKSLMLNEGIQVVDSPLWLAEGVVTAMSNIVPTVVRLVTAGRQISEMNEQVNEDRRLVGDMERTLIERATHVLPNTTGTLVNARKAYGLSIAEGSYTIVPYGIVPVSDDAVRPFDATVRHETLTVLFVGRLEKRKGIAELFEAIPAVLARVPQARFVIAGADNSRNDGFFQRNGLSYPDYFAKHFAHAANKVTFLGQVSDEKLGELYQTCDLFVAPSLYESFGLIYLEAMNYGKPVIGGNAGGVPEVISDGVNGVLVEPGQAASLAEAITRLLQSPSSLREMGLAGRSSVVNQFSYVQMARNFADAYRIAIGRWQAQEQST